MPYGYNPTSKTTTKLNQQDGYHDDSRLGVKGQEDLGSGLSAIFKAEMRFKADTGIASTQLAESYVGLKGSFGEVTVGRRLTITDDLFGYDSNAKELSGTGLGTTFNNSLSYRGTFGGLTVGADVTTGENITRYSGNGRAYQYAAGAQYRFGAGAVAAGYEHTIDGQNAYALGLKYKVGAVEMFGRVTRTKLANSYNSSYISSYYSNESTTKGTGFALGLNYAITPNDVLSVSYSQLNKKYKNNSNYIYPYSNYTFLSISREKSRMLSFDYTHSLSKRTSVYAGASFSRTKYTNENLYHTNDGSLMIISDLPLSSQTRSKSYSYNIGLKHSF